MKLLFPALVAVALWGCQTGPTTGRNNLVYSTPDGTGKLSVLAICDAKGCWTADGTPDPLHSAWIADVPKKADNPHTGEKGTVDRIVILQRETSGNLKDIRVMVDAAVIGLVGPKSNLKDSLAYRLSPSKDASTGFISLSPIPEKDCTPLKVGQELKGWKLDSIAHIPAQAGMVRMYILFGTNRAKGNGEDLAGAKLVSERWPGVLTEVPFQRSAPGGSKNPLNIYEGIVGKHPALIAQDTLKSLQLGPFALEPKK